ncbi:MAG: YafY family protein [Anaerolineaceae bacterium]|nr:YafY family protein [Anaerolineaceae bacterium]
MRADRLLSIVLILQSQGGRTAEELAVQLEVSERTIYRDIEALSYAGIPIYTHPGVSGGIFLDEGYRGSMTTLTNAEAQAIVLTSGAAPLQDLGLEKAASGMLLKLLAALPAAQRDAAERLRRCIFIDPAGWFHSNESVPFLPVLHKVVWEDRVIELSYQRPDGALTQRELHPYALIAKANVWYLVGKQADGEMRTFRVSRIQNVRVQETCFQRPEDFDLTTYWHAQCALFEKQMLEGEVPCEVLVRVHPDGLRSLVSDLTGQYERQSSPGQQEWPTLRIKFDSREAAQSRMQAFGNRVEVLEPDWLRQRLLEEALAVANRYGG